MILVTGAGGHLGANLLRRLVAEGHAVRALIHTARDEPALEGLRVEHMTGDLRDPALAAAAVQGCRQVHHCAAKVSTTYRNQDELFSCNVLATRHLLMAAQRAGVEKVVVTGSFGAVGIRSDGGPSDETVPFNPLDRHMPYAQTKAAVEHECLKACAAGLPVVVAVSTAIVGPFDFKPSRMGQVLIRFAQGRLRAFSSGGVPFVAARDVAQGHILAMERGKAGHKYIFSSEFMTFDQMMALMSRVTGRPIPPLRVPAAVMSAAATVASLVMPVIRPSAQQLLTPGAVRTLRLHRRADISKASNEIGYQPTSIEGAIREAHDWFVAHGMIGHRGLARSLAAEELRV